MYNKKNQGHGICGSRNIYNSKVHVDNWIEDNIGMNLIKAPRPGNVLYQTNTAASFNHPAERPEPPPLPANIPSTLELKTKNKDGMSYALLFEHSQKQSEIEERFKSNAMLTIMNRREDASQADRHYSLSQRKAKQMTEDMHKSNVKVSEAKIANSHLKFQPSDTIIPFEKTADLPNFRRRNPISSMFVSGI